MKSLLTSFINRNKTHRKDRDCRIHTNHARRIDAHKIEGWLDDNAAA